MNTAELVAAVAEKTGKTKVDTDTAVKATLDAIRDALAAGSEVRLAGFGNFTPKSVAERTARNPRTGEPLIVPAQRKATFKAAKGLTDALRA